MLEYTDYYAPARTEGIISVAFVRPSVRPSVRRVYIGNNSRTQRPSVPKFGRTVPHLYNNNITIYKAHNVRKKN